MMGETTGISWTQHTWNPWKGCHKISPGCKNCYMFTDQLRYKGQPNVVLRTKTWGDPGRWQRKAAAAGRREFVFTCSWSDWFVEEADPWRDEAWKIVKETPNLVYQILTKRADRIVDCLPADWGAGYPNVWLGCSVENQAFADQRIPYLLRAPAAIRFVSCEPALGPVDWSRWLHPFEICCDEDGNDFGSASGGSDIDWIIVGGESGPGSRPFQVKWAEATIRQCEAAGVACFVKQFGALPDIREWWDESQVPHVRQLIRADKADDPEEWPLHLRVQQWPITL